MKKRRSLSKILITILAVLGVLFLVILIMPEDEEEAAPFPVSINTLSEESSTGSSEPMAAHSDKEYETVSVGTDAGSATVMIYLNGSDLESEAGEATTDISEMIASGVGKNVHVVIQTMGTKRWQDYGISSRTAQTYTISDGSLKLVRDELGQLDCTSPDTLSEFISFSKTTYPAERYILIFWDHGGGPVYGFGYDEWQDEDASLTIAEMAQAFKENADIHFDIIGMDCCIMGNLETCYALAPYCRYALLSEDFESGLGWSYTDWMRRFEEDPSISTPLLGKYIVDSMIDANEKDRGGDSSCIALFNESTIGALFQAWMQYAYQNEDALLGKNYSRQHRAKGRTRSDIKAFWGLWDMDLSSVTLSDYYISDMLALIESIDSDSEAAKKLISALKACVAYYGHTSDTNELTGIAVSLPYGDRDFYNRLREVYTELGVDQEYVNWLKAFASTAGNTEYYDFAPFSGSWGGWGAYEEEYGCSMDNPGALGECAYDYGDDRSSDDWIYDYEDELWYYFEDDLLYMYDDESEMMFCYDEDEDMLYYYDEGYDDWFEADW